MKFFKKPAGEILTGLVECLVITGVGIYALAADGDGRIIIPTMALYADVDPLSRIGVGISDIAYNTKRGKHWNSECF